LMPSLKNPTNRKVLQIFILDKFVKGNKKGRG
jgi:hypothetical protein